MPGIDIDEISAVVSAIVGRRVVLVVVGVVSAVVGVVFVVGTIVGLLVRVLVGVVPSVVVVAVGHCEGGIVVYAQFVDTVPDMVVVRRGAGLVGPQLQ